MTGEPRILVQRSCREQPCLGCPCQILRLARLAGAGTSLKGLLGEAESLLGMLGCDSPGRWWWPQQVRTQCPAPPSMARSLSQWAMPSEALGVSSPLKAADLLPQVR